MHKLRRAGIKPSSASVMRTNMKRPTSEKRRAYEVPDLNKTDFMKNIVRPPKPTRPVKY